MWIKFVDWFHRKYCRKAAPSRPVVGHVKVILRRFKKMAIATIPVTPTLTRADGTALTLADLASVTGFLSVKGANAFAAIGTVPAAALVKFVLPDVTPGDYDFYAVETDTQVPPLSSANSAIKSFSVPVPVVVLAAPSAPVVGDAVIS